MTDWAFAGKLTTVTIACLVIAAVIVKRAREWYRAPLTVEQERQGVVVGMIPQHSPGVSVGDWVDEYQIDPAYDALEAIRSQVS